MTSRRPRDRSRERRAATWLAAAALLLSVACQAAAPAAVPPRTDAPPAQVDARQAPAAAAVDHYDLARDEARGGHTLARHVGRSDAELRERLRREGQISAASTYTDRATAERVVGTVLRRERARTQKWLAGQGPRPNLTLDYHGDRRQPIGRTLMRRSPQPVSCADAVVVLRWDGRGGFIVLTSYPEISR